MTDLGLFNPDLYAKGDPWKSGLPLDLFAELRDDRPCYWQPLEDERLQASPGEKRRGHQTVVAAADDDRVTHAVTSVTGCARESVAPRFARVRP